MKNYIIRFEHLAIIEEEHYVIIDSGENLPEQMEVNDSEELTLFLIADYYIKSPTTLSHLDNGLYSFEWADSNIKHSLKFRAYKVSPAGVDFLINQN